MAQKQIRVKGLTLLLENFEERELMIFTFRENSAKGGYVLSCQIKNTSYILYGASHSPKERVFKILDTGVLFLKKLGICKFVVVLEAEIKK